MFEVVDPAIHQMIEASNSLLKRYRTGLLGDDFDFLFESFPAFLSDAQAVFALVSLFVRRHKTVSQQYKFGGSANTRFLLIDF